MTRLASLASLLLGSCGAPALLPADPSATLDPVAFFAGHSRGAGTLDTISGTPHAVAVDSNGKTIRAGKLVLDQLISEAGKPVRARRWIMVPAGPGHFTGSLTDASGPVDIHVQGPRATITYRMKNGMAVHQQLALQQDGRTILNRLTVSRFGIRLARLDETIRKLD